MLTINTKLTLPKIIIIILVCKATKGNILDIFCLVLTLLHLHACTSMCLWKMYVWAVLAVSLVAQQTHSCGTCKCTRAPRTCSPWSRMWNLKQYDVFHSFFSSLDLPLSSICMHVQIFVYSFLSWLIIWAFSILWLLIFSLCLLSDQLLQLGPAKH